jgi:hypothetical protein
MRRFSSAIALGAVITSVLSGCGGGSNNGDVASAGGSGASPPVQAPPLVSNVGTAGVFVAYADPGSGNFASAPIGSYGGKRQSLHGNVDFMTGANQSQPAGIEIYEGSDGHIYGLDLTSAGAPAPQQLSSESAATIDDACTLSGATAAGGNYDYVGVYFAADLQTTTNSSYFYRLPGPDGVCGTADDVIHMVKTGMTATSTPIVASDLPVATVHSASGGILGFVIKSGANLVLVDGNFANPIVLGTFSAPIGVAVALPVGTTQGYPTGQLYVVDGNIVYVNYVANTVSAALYTIPNWTPTNAAALFAASPSTLYFSINTAASGSTPAAAGIYAMPADGSAAPTMVDSEPGRVASLLFPVQGSDLIWGIVNPTYTIRTLAVAGGSATTLMSSTQNAGAFIATASTVYYETWTGTTDSATRTVTRSGTQSGILGLNGTVIQPPLVNSTFVNGGEQLPWPDDTTTTMTPFRTVFQIRGLSPVTVVDAGTGYQYTEDGVGGGALLAVDTTSNQVVAAVGTLPASTAITLSGTFRGSADTGFLEAQNPLSSQDPATRDLYLLNSQTANTLLRVTSNL